MSNGTQKDQGRSIFARQPQATTSPAATAAKRERAAKPREKANILLVDDQPQRLLSYEAILAELGENLVRAHSGTEALARLMESEFAVILLDVNMPGMDGFETANLIHQHPRFEKTPIIFVTGIHVTDLDRLKGYKLGAVDYVYVPVVPEILRSKVCVLVELYNQRRELRSLNRNLEKANSELAHANTLLAAEKARELEQMNMTLEHANSELGRTNRSLQAEILERRRAEERMKFLAESIPSIVWTAAPDGTVTYANPHWAEYYGPMQENRPARLIDLVLHPDDAAMAREHVIGRLQNGEPVQFEARHRGHDGSYRWFLTRAVPWRDAEGHIVSWFGITADIDDHKALEEQLRETDRRKDEFLATLAHELRNPLAPLQNALHILRLDPAGGDAARSALGVMARQMQQMVRLVDDLLDVSRITRGRLELRRESCRFSAVVEDAIETVRPLIASLGHHLEVDLPQEPLMLDADPHRLAQVFANLLNNACKYTDPGGRIALRAQREGDQVVLKVTDSGIGIAPELASQIFDVFVQADTALERSRGGLGIGLTLVRSLIEMHGGTVTVRSDGIGKGSEFTVRLPLATAVRVPGAPIGVAQVATPASEPGALRIMVVDDNRDAADTLAMSLAMLGHEVRTVYDSPQVVGSAAAFQPDLVFMDIGMPRMNGYDVARAIREQEWGGDTMLVALTGWGKEDDRAKSRNAGFDHHLVKPADLDEILRLCDVARSHTARAGTP
ncbi:MAG TPA: response regulator [Xanthomonadales bacterium]|nr:response regulator [Xanthomonadales bacterium]